MKYFKSFAMMSALSLVFTTSAFAATKQITINTPTQHISISTEGISEEEFLKIWENQFQIPFPVPFETGVYNIFDNTVQPSPTVPPTQAEQSSEQQNVSEYVQKVVELTNVERTKNGLSALTINDSLNAAAQKHAEDMYINNYFSHTSQDGRTMSNRVQEYTTDYTTLGENIAMGQQTPEEVVAGWMNSPGHRANILNGNFQEIGIGYSHHYWVQNFLGK